MSGEEFLTVQEVADRLRFSSVAVRAWIDEGRLPALRIGRVWRVRSADLERLLASGLPTSAPTPTGGSERGVWDSPDATAARLILPEMGERQRAARVP